MKKRKRQVRPALIERAVYMANSGYSKEEFRFFVLALRDVRMISRVDAAAMNRAFCKEFAHMDGCIDKSACLKGDAAKDRPE